MTEQQLQEMEAWFAEAACFDDCDEHDEAAIASLIADVRRLQQENAVLRNGVELQRCVVNAAYEDKCKAEQQRDAALAERDEYREENGRLRKALSQYQQPGALVRFGVQHEPGPWLLTVMEDGYWTPWHIANADAVRLEAERDAALAAVLAQEEAK